jgi:hypothetical protein
MRVGAVWIRRMATAVVVLALVASLVSCWGAGKGKSEGNTHVQMDAIAAQIQSTLAARPDVAVAKVFYNNDITDPGFANASITVKSGIAFAPIVDAAVRLIWQSKLNPLKSIRIGIQDEVNDQRYDVRHLDASGTDEASLEQKYGVRPK